MNQIYTKFTRFHSFSILNGLFTNSHKKKRESKLPIKLLIFEHSRSQVHPLVSYSLSGNQNTTLSFPKTKMIWQFSVRSPFWISPDSFFSFLKWVLSPPPLSLSLEKSWRLSVAIKWEKSSTLSHWTSSQNDYLLYSIFKNPFGL